MDSWTETAHQTENGIRLRRYRSPHLDAYLLISHRRHDRCLMDVEREILNRLILHGSRSFPALVVWRFQGSRKERAFNVR
jgi:hypothetical protein